MSLIKQKKKLKRCYEVVMTKDKRYYIGTSSATIYVYDVSTLELITKFSDVPYGNHIFLSDDDNILIVKSSEPKIAVYDLSTLTLRFIVKIKGNKQPQDGGLCFSPSLTHIYNIVYDNDLFSYVMKIDLRDGSYHKAYQALNEVYWDILYVAEHQRYYLIGFRRGSVLKRFVKIFDCDFQLIQCIDLDKDVIKVEYSPSEDLFYARSMGYPFVFVFSRDFSKVVKEFSSELVLLENMFSFPGTRPLVSKHGFVESFSLNKKTLHVVVRYSSGVVLYNHRSEEVANIPMIFGFSNFSNAEDELYINGEIYRIAG